MKLKHREIARTLDEIVKRAQSLRDECESLCIRANTDMDDGISGISYDGKSRQSGPSDPVGSRVERNRRDKVAETAKVFRQSVEDAFRVINRAEKAGWSLRALDEKEAQALTNDEISNTKEQTIQPHCANPHCQRLVARTANDRLRGGRCDACRKYLDRNGIERPKVLCDLSADAVSTLEIDQDRVVTTDVA